MDKYKIIGKIDLLYLVIFALIVRLILSSLPPFEIDQIGWRFWSYRMAEVGPSGFYTKDIFTDNPPGFLYIFWLIGEVRILFADFFNTNPKIFDLLLKLPTNLADITTASLIYCLLKKKINQKVAILGFLSYILNPAIIFNTSIWGQFDGFAFTFLLASVISLVEFKNPVLSAIFTAVAWTIKPQAIAIAPALGLYSLINLNLKQLLQAITSFFLTLLVIYLPFFPTNPLIGILYINQAMTGIFNCTTCFAFNFWGIFGNWRQDNLTFWGITYLNWGFLLFSLCLTLIYFFRSLIVKFRSPLFYFTLSLTAFSFYMFITRMHERYLFPFFGFFLIFSLLMRSKLLYALYLFLSVLHLVNIYLPYDYYNNQLILTNPFSKHLMANFTNYSAISFISFLILIIYYMNLSKSFKKNVH